MTPKLQALDFQFAASPVRAFVDAVGNAWFIAADVAQALGYERPRDAVAQHCKGAVKHRILTAGGRQQVVCVPERDLYRLVMRSRLPAAEAFEEWVVGTVLPSIRQTGEFRAQWSKNRLQAAASYRVMNEVLRMTRQEQGKKTVQHHYSNEARLINYVLCGKFAGLTRDGLPDSVLALIAHLEERNAILIARDVVYHNRKTMLEQYAMDWRMQHGQLSRRDLLPHDCDQI